MGGGETHMRWVNNRKQRDCQQKKRREDHIKEEVEYWPFSLGALMQSYMWQTTPFHPWPCSNLNQWIGCTHTHTPPFLLVFHPVSSMASPLHPFLLSLSLLVLHPLPIYFHLPHTLHSLHSPPNRQGCCRWHVSSWEQPCRVDGLQYTERRDSPTTQPSVSAFCVCSYLCALVYLVHLTDPTAAPMIWLSQYAETMYVCVSELFLF